MGEDVSDSMPPEVEAMLRQIMRHQSAGLIKKGTAHALTRVRTYQESLESIRPGDESLKLDEERVVEIVVGYLVPAVLSASLRASAEMLKSMGDDFAGEMLEYVVEMYTKMIRELPPDGIDAG